MIASKLPALVAGGLLLLTLLPAPAEAQNDECSFGGLGLFFMDLRFPFRTNLVPAGVTVLTEPTPSTHEFCDGWHEAVIRITIPDGCFQANVWIEYSDFPIGWTIHLGDSLTNNGFGGDATNEGDNAQLAIFRDRLTVMSEVTSGEQTHVFANQFLALGESALKITFGNRIVSWGQPYTRVFSDELFSIPSDVDGKAVYLGVNRVIADDDDRKGCGVSRVMVSFE